MVRLIVFCLLITSCSPVIRNSKEHIENYDECVRATQQPCSLIPIPDAAQEEVLDILRSYIVEK